MKPSGEAKKDAEQRAREHEQHRKDNEAALRAIRARQAAAAQKGRR